MEFTYMTNTQIINATEYLACKTHDNVLLLDRVKMQSELCELKSALELKNRQIAEKDEMIDALQADLTHILVQLQYSQ
jgi:hypothetical protein